MGLEAVVHSSLKETKDLGRPEQAKVVSAEVLTTLEDTAVRREVFDIITEQDDDLSMREVHLILDALVRVCTDK